MKKILFAALFAFAVVAAAPASADCPNCKNCPSKVATTDKKDEVKKDCGCPSTGADKVCKCKEGCKCGHCAAGHKHEEKKS